jgi:peptidoglycan/LPS O-acetylase OafA/YrhL
VPLPRDQDVFRKDIQGMRALAVLLVLAYHARVPGFGGGFVGVDVFFVISGFLITGLMLREAHVTGSVNLPRFWARRARRLLPATAVVISAVGVVTLVVLPVTRWASTAGDMAASALYVVNWRFAGQALDYFAAEAPASPLQHFWSLAVEEQFYLLWPVLLFALLWVRRKTNWPLGGVLLAGIGLIGAVSLAWSVHLTAALPGRAFFVSTTRAWELAVGGVLAVGLGQLVGLRHSFARLLGWLGLVAILAAAFTFDETTPFPGYAALLPSLGTAALIVSGIPGSDGALRRLLSLRPMQSMGALSYSLYLWHWPVLVAATWLWGGLTGSLAAPIGALAVAASAIPAWLTYRLVESPIHYSAVLARFPRRALAVGLACTALGLAAGQIVSFSVPRSPAYAATSGPAVTVSSIESVNDTTVPSTVVGEGGEAHAGPEDAVVAPMIAAGAAVLGDDPNNDPDGRVTETVSFMVPSPAAAPEDIATLNGERCIEGLDSRELKVCEYGPGNADTVVAVVGDSKIHQWLPAIQLIADQRGWRVLTYLKSGCPLVRVPIERQGAVFQQCSEYNEARYAALLGSSDIDYVITSQVATVAYLPDKSAVEQGQAMVEDLRRTWLELEQHGIDVIVLLDNGSPGLAVPDCVAAFPQQLSRCASPREESLARGAATTQLEALRGVSGVEVVDIRDWICPGDACPAVIGNVLVYRRGSHLTATYVRSLAPRLDTLLAITPTGEGRFP